MYQLFLCVSCDSLLAGSILFLTVKALMKTLNSVTNPRGMTLITVPYLDSVFLSILL